MSLGVPYNPQEYRDKLLSALSDIQMQIDAKIPLFFEALGHEIMGGERFDAHRGVILEIAELRSHLVKLEALVKRALPLSEK